jgi:hypothetical protein
VFDTFLAGYQAAKDEEATKDQKIAELWAESFKNMLPSVHEITLFPSKPSNDEVVAKMDAAIEKAKGNSLNNSNGWISVKERLPEIPENDRSDRVLLLRADRFIVIARIEKCVRFVRPFQEALIVETDNGDPIEEFTHWMPLPEAPKEER